MTTVQEAQRVTAGARWANGRRTLRNAYRRAGRVLTATRARYRRPALTVSGLGCFAAAGFQISVLAGLVVTGVALLVFEWLGGDG